MSSGNVPVLTMRIGPVRTTPRKVERGRRQKPATQKATSILEAKTGTNKFDTKRTRSLDQAKTQSPRW